MRIYSVPGTAGTCYDINLDQIGRDYWIAPTRVVEAAYLPTSTANAGVFRQVTKYDVSALSRKFQVVLADAEAVILQAMAASTQTEWYVDNGTGVYRCNVVIDLAFSQGRAVASIAISVIAAI